MRSSSPNAACCRYPSTSYPLGRRAARAWEQIREGEEATLAAIEDVQVLDGLVSLAVLEVAHAVAVVAFQEHSHKGVEEVQVLGRRLQRERVDSDAMLSSRLSLLGWTLADDERPAGRLPKYNLERRRTFAIADCAHGIHDARRGGRSGIGGVGRDSEGQT